MTNAAMVRVLAAALRAAADELERGSVSEGPKKLESQAEITELDRARADKIWRALESG